MVDQELVKTLCIVIFISCIGILYLLTKDLTYTVTKKQEEPDDN